jgi:putative inorganic carbon (hco3(-)) transporter
MGQVDRVEDRGRVSVLRMSLPAGRVELPPVVGAISRRLPSVLLALWVLTLPLEFTKTYFPNQNLEVSRVVIGLCLLTFAAQVIFERREIRVPASAGVLGLALFTAYAAVSASAVGSALGIKTVLAMVAYLLMMLTVFNWTHTAADHRRIWSALAVSVVVVALVGLVLHATNSYIWNAPNVGVSRVNATFHDPNIFARFLAFSMLALALLVVDLDVTRRQRVLWVAAVFTAAVVFPFTYSRAAWALTVVAALVLIAVARRKKPVLALIATAAAVFAAVAIIDPSVLDRAALLASNLQSPFTNKTFVDRAPWLSFLQFLPLDSIRQYLIGAGLIMFVDHPIFGTGFGTFSQALTGPYAGLIPLGVDTITSHTSIVTILSETGLVGLAIVLLAGFDFVWSTVWKGVDSVVQRTLVVAPAIALLVIFLDSQLTGRLFDEPYLWLFLGLAYAARAGLEDDPATTPAASPAGAVSRSSVRPSPEPRPVQPS